MICPVFLPACLSTRSQSWGAGAWREEQWLVDSDIGGRNNTPQITSGYRRGQCLSTRSVIAWNGSGCRRRVKYLGLAAFCPLRLHVLLVTTITPGSSVLLFYPIHFFKTKKVFYIAFNYVLLSICKYYFIIFVLDLVLYGGKRNPAVCVSVCVDSAVLLYWAVRGAESFPATALH